MKGINGETAVSRALHRLPAAWWYLDNVVLGSGPGAYAQIDHVAVGPGGVYAIETKYWSGALLGSHDTWRRKQGGGWKRVESPSTQSRRHAERIREHLAAYGVEVPVTPVVVFVNADWVRWTDCTGLIFDGAGAMRRALARSTGDALLEAGERRRVADLIALGVLPERSDATPASAATGSPDAECAPRSPDRDGKDPGGAAAGRPATGRQRAYVRQLLTRAGLAFADERIDRMTAREAQAVIDKVRFHKDVELPPLG